jgi:hypothetical protein
VIDVRLSEFAKTLRIKMSGGGSFYGSEENFLHDDLVRPFNLSSAQEAELVELKKAALYDETTKARIPALKATIAANRKVLDRLENAVAEMHLEPLSLGRLRQCQQELVWKIRAEESELANFISPFFESALTTLGDAGLKAAAELPKVVEARAASAAKIRGYQDGYSKLGQQISMLEGILKDFQW